MTMLRLLPLPFTAATLVAIMAPAPTVVEDPLPWDDERTILTKEYRTAHLGEEDPGISIVPRVVVLHWTGGGSVRSTWNTFASTRLGGDRPGLTKGGSVNVSAHYCVARDGTIHRFLPDDRFARHVIGLNQVSIGVENVGGPDALLTEEQVVSNATLIRYLVGKHDTITHLIGHHEYRKMEGHPYFFELDPTYRTGKTDPGDAFMTAVRERAADLGLEGPPPAPVAQ